MSVVITKWVRFRSRVWRLNLIPNCIFYFRYVPLPKSATPSRIRSNANLYDFELEEEDMAKLDALDRGKAGSVSWNPVDAP